MAGGQDDHRQRGGDLEDCNLSCGEEELREGLMVWVGDDNRDMVDGGGPDGGDYEVWISRARLLPEKSPSQSLESFSRLRKY